MNSLSEATISAPPEKSKWAAAWPDLLAFLLGLAVARFSGWNTTDLVWSLWLSSLVVGYAIIVWTIYCSLESSLARLAAGLGTLLFFTVHFGMFHFVHSVFLAQFFPLGDGQRNGMPGPEFYSEVFRSYWVWIPVALLAERLAFKRPSRLPGERPPDPGAGMMAPYKNVVRLHLLIFFFAFAHFAKVESFAVYAVVYVVYFFPWRLLFSRKTDAVS